MKGTSASGGVDGTLHAEEKDELVVVVGVLVGEDKIIEACAGGGLEGRRWGEDLCCMLRKRERVGPVPAKTGRVRGKEAEADSVADGSRRQE